MVPGYVEQVSMDLVNLELDTWPQMADFLAEYFPKANLEVSRTIWEKWERESKVALWRDYLWLSREGMADVYLVSKDDPAKRYDMFDCFCWSRRRRYRGKPVKVILKRL